MRKVKAHQQIKRTGPGDKTREDPLFTLETTNRRLLLALNNERRTKCVNQV
jgi:hypothetical protein